jgi:transcriptional regulator with XRE-family HTH domain
MDSRKILADNLKTLKAYADLPNAKLAAKCGVSNGTISNALLAKNALDIDTLDAIAKAFHLSAWQLLVPNLEPRNPHHITNISESEAALYERLKNALKSSQ